MCHTGSHLPLRTVVSASSEALQEPEPSLPGVLACFSGFCFNFQLSPSTHDQWSSLVRNPRNSAISLSKMSSQKLSLMLKFLNFLNSLNSKFSESSFRVFFFLNPLIHLGFIFMCVHAKSLQSCPTLCDPMDYSPPGSPVYATLQARILEQVAMPSPGDLLDPVIEHASFVSCIGRWVPCPLATSEALYPHIPMLLLMYLLY